MKGDRIERIMWYHVSMVGSGKMIHAIHSRNDVTFCDRSEKIEGHKFLRLPSTNFGLS